jgi:hypothetical protein
MDMGTMPTRSPVGKVENLSDSANQLPVNQTVMG